MAEEIGKILEKHNENIKRHIDVLKEDFDSKIDLIIGRQDLGGFLVNPIVS